MNHHLILVVLSRALIPGIMLFGLYVQFHGDYGPGGGFQAGVIFASAFLLYGLVFGGSRLQKCYPPQWALTGTCAGLLLYLFTGIAGMLAGASFLDHNVLQELPADGQHLGIFVVELGVGITVFSVILSLFYSFADYHSRQLAGEDTDTDELRR